MNQEQKQVKLGDLTNEQLKVAVYDLNTELKRVTNTMKVLNDEIASRSVESSTVEEPVKSAEEVKDK